LEHLLAQDSLNAFCFEKLSEVYWEMGKKEKALAAAREAVRLDPTVKNQWRLDDFEHEIREKKRRRGRWKLF